MRDYRNDFLQEVKLAVMECEDSDRIVSKISVILEKYELSPRVTDIVPCDNENAELLKQYAGSLIISGKSRKTIEHYSRELKKFASCGGKLLEKKPYDIKNYLAQKKLSGISNRTLDNIRSVISAFYSWLEAEEYIEKNPCRGIKPIKYKRELKTPFSDVEIDKLRNSCKKKKERAIIEFLLSSGVRVSEFCAMDVQDIDFDHKKVRVREGKGGKERFTYINEIALEHLKDYLDGRTDGALFVTQLGDRYTKSGVEYVLHALEKRSGVENVHPHRFRRTFATTLAKRGMKVQNIQKLMGHSNINTTMLYITTTDAETKNAYERVA